MTASTTMTETPVTSRARGAPHSGTARPVSPKLLERLEREERAKRGLFIASIAALAAALGLVAAAAGGPQVLDTAKPVAASESPDQRVIAEVPIQPTDGQPVTTIVRIVAPASGAPPPEVRTRATS